MSDEERLGLRFLHDCKCGATFMTPDQNPERCPDCAAIMAVTLLDLDQTVFLPEAVMTKLSSLQLPAAMENVYWELCRYAQQEKGLPTDAWLCEKTGLSTTTLAEAIAQLIDVDLITEKRIPRFSKIEGDHQR